MPVLIDGDTVLTRPEAILIHLAERHDPAGRFLPGDGADPRRGDRLAVLRRGRPQGRRGGAPQVPVRGGVGLRRPLRHGADRLPPAGRPPCARQTLRGARFFVGDQATLADLAIFPAVALAADFGLGMEEFPRLLTWSRRLHALPGFITMSGVREMV